MRHDACKELSWDTSFFGVRVARYEGERLTEESARAALEFCRVRQIECLYLLLRDEPESNSVAESCSWEWAPTLVDTRLTLSRPLAGLNLPAQRCPVRDAEPRVAEPRVAQPRDAEPWDLVNLRKIARTSHRDSRFYSDPHFDRGRCDALYQLWIEQSCAGSADRVLVADHGGEAAGYITCKTSESGCGSIGLFAVAEQARGRGLGSSLIVAALSFFESAGMHSVEVVTQERNAAAQRAYESHGFAPLSRRLWYHAWLSPRAALPGRNVPEKVAV